MYNKDLIICFKNLVNALTNLSCHLSSVLHIEYPRRSSITIMEEELNNFKKWFNEQPQYSHITSSNNPYDTDKEWLIKRRNMITASDVHTILYNSDKMKQDILTKKKNPELLPTYVNYYMREGKNQEKTIRRAIYKRMKCPVLKLPLVTHKKYKFLGATPDGIIKYNNKLCLVEIKTRFKIDNMKTKIQKNHKTQIQIQLEVCDIDVCYYCQYFPDTKLLKIIKEKRDKNWFNSIILELINFYTLLSLNNRCEVLFTRSIPQDTKTHNIDTIDSKLPHPLRGQSRGPTEAVSFQQKDITNTDFRIIKISVKGTFYRQKNLKNSYENYFVFFLVDEPDNKYDKDAVKVVTVPQYEELNTSCIADNHIGYIPKGLKKEVTMSNVIYIEIICSKNSDGVTLYNANLILDKSKCSDVLLQLIH
jgi:putative phage-type endonuclease